MAESHSGLRWPEKIKWIRLGLDEGLSVHKAVPEALTAGFVIQAQMLEQYLSTEALTALLTLHPLGVTEEEAGSMQVVTGLASWRVLTLYQQARPISKAADTSKSISIPALIYSRLTDADVIRLARFDVWMGLITHVPLQFQLASVMAAIQDDLSRDGLLDAVSPRLKSPAALARFLDRSRLPPRKPRGGLSDRLPSEDLTPPPTPTDARSAHAKATVSPEDEIQLELAQQEPRPEMTPLSGERLEDMQGPERADSKEHVGAAATIGQDADQVVDDAMADPYRLAE